MHLLAGVDVLARKVINVHVAQSGCPRRVDRVDAVRINTAEGLIATNDGEGHGVVGGEALEVVLRMCLADINSEDVAASSDRGHCCEEAKHGGGGRSCS